MTVNGHGDIEIRVMNWARWARGGLPRALRRRESTQPVDAFDAQLVESTLCTMKRVRPYYWRIVKVRWLHPRPLPRQLAAIRRGETAYYQDVHAVLSWLEQQLGGQLPD